MPNKSQQGKKSKLTAREIAPEMEPQSTGPANSADSLKGVLMNVVAEAKSIADRLPGSTGFPDPSIENHVNKLRLLVDELYSVSRLEHAIENTRDEIARTIETLPFTLKEFCAKENLQLEGAFPDHIINGTTYLAFHKSALRFTLNDSTVGLFPTDNLFQSIIKEVQSQKKRVFEAGKFLENLWSAYQRVLNKEGMQQEDNGSARANIYSLLLELALIQQTKSFLTNPTQPLFKSYSQHALRADLYSLLMTHEEPVFKYYRLRLDTQSVAEKGIFMFLPSLGRCALISHIVFERA